MKTVLRMPLLFIIFSAFLVSSSSGQIGTVLKTIPTISGHQPSGLTWDGTYLWMIDYTEDQICKINPETGEIITTIPAPGVDCTGLAWDGTYLWCSDNATDRLYKITPSGTIINWFPVTSTPRGCEFFNGNIWYIDSVNLQIYKLNPTTGVFLDSIPAPAGSCRGLAYDGKYLWCTDRS